MKRRKNCSKGSFSPNGLGPPPPGPPGPPPPGPPGPPPPGPPGPPPPGPPGPPPGPPGNGPKPRNPSFFTVVVVEMLTTAGFTCAATSASDGSGPERPAGAAAACG